MFVAAPSDDRRDPSGTGNVMRTPSGSPATSAPDSTTTRVDRELRLAVGLALRPVEEAAVRRSRASPDVAAAGRLRASVLNVSSWSFSPWGVSLARRRRGAVRRRDSSERLDLPSAAPFVGRLFFFSRSTLLDDLRRDGVQQPAKRMTATGVAAEGSPASSVYIFSGNLAF